MMVGEPVYSGRAAQRALHAVGAPGSAKARRLARQSVAVSQPGFFIERCLRSWALAPSIRDFLDNWTPLALLDLGLGEPVVRRRARRPAAPPRAVNAMRAARKPRPRRAGSATGKAIFGTMTPSALRRSFPYVAELLVEMAELSDADRRRASGPRP
jgi:hypothetical protein